MNVFDKLQRIFSTGLIVSDIKNDTIKVIDTQRSQAYKKRNNMGSKLRRSSMLNSGMSQNYTVNRLALYRDYDMMDADPLLSSALDIYVFEALTKDEFGDILKIKSQDKQIQDILRQLFYQRLNCQFNFSIWFRNFVKYGDFPLALKLDEQMGVIGAEPISPYDFERVQDEESDSQGYYFKITGSNEIIDNYNIAHFRLIKDTNFLPYGKSVFESARRTWKSLTLMIDAMMIQRIMRAPERRVFKVDVGDLSNQQIEPFMKDVINAMKKVPYRDPQTGQINLKYNLQNILQDFYFPVKGPNDGSSVQTLPGVQNSMIEDIQFIKGYMLTALKIPKAFLAYEEGIQSKATLASLDIIFARYIEDLQKLFVNELYRIALIHLIMVGHTDLNNMDFTLSLNNPSDVKKIQQIELWNQKVELATKMQQSHHFSYNYIYKNIYELSEEQSIKMMKQVISDSKYRRLLTDIQNGQSEGSGDWEYDEDNQHSKETETDKVTGQMQDSLDVDTSVLQNNNFVGNTPLNVD